MPIQEESDAPAPGQGDLEGDDVEQHKDDQELDEQLQLPGQAGDEPVQPVVVTVLLLITDLGEIGFLRKLVS